MLDESGRRNGVGVDKHNRNSFEIDTMNDGETVPMSEVSVCMHSKKPAVDLDTAASSNESMDVSLQNSTSMTFEAFSPVESTQASNQISRKHMTPSSSKWFHAIQQERDIKKPTLRQQCPKVWDLVGSYIKTWKEDNWEGPSEKVNPSDFKKKVAKHILETRVKIQRSEIPCQNLLPSDTGPLVYFYSQMTFEEFAERNYKKIESKSKALDIQPNDVIRFFGVAFLGTNRDDLVSIGIGKATSRQQLDSDLSMTDSIMRSWQREFSNYAVLLGEPSRAVYLDSYIDLDPNDHTRIEIKRDWKFFKNLFFSYLSKYNVSMKKWTKGTGGGPGADENYSNWMERDDELFVNYCGNKDKDVLAWIYMLDKKEGFPLNVRNNPPPEDTVMEDGATSNATSTPRKGKRKASTKSMQMMESFTSTMDKRVEQVFTTLDNLAKAHKGNKDIKIAKRLEAFELIEVCEKKLKELREEECGDHDDDNIRLMKIDKLENILFETFESLPSSNQNK